MVRVVVDAVDIVAAGVLVVCLLLCGTALAVIWVKQKLDEWRKK